MILVVVVVVVALPAAAATAIEKVIKRYFSKRKRWYNIQCDFVIILVRVRARARIRNAPPSLQQDGKDEAEISWTWPLSEP